VCVYWC